MTPRDHYAAAALSGLLRATDGECAEHVAAAAIVLAQCVANAACASWGHDYPRRDFSQAGYVPPMGWCRRCGAKQK